MTYRRFILFSVFAAALAGTVQQAAAQLWSGILAPARATDWSGAGVTGGIPSSAWTQCTNSYCAAVTNAGTGATAAQIKAAMENAPANTYVQLAAGTYNLSTGICVHGANNVELRGAGANSTFLKFSSAVGCLAGTGTVLIGFESTDGTYAGGVSTFATWKAAGKGATTLTFPNGFNGMKITPGATLVILDQCNTGYTGTSGTAACTGAATDNGSYFNCGDVYTSTPTGCGYQGQDGGAGRSHRFQTQIVQAVSCSPNCSASSSATMTINDPLIHPNWNDGNGPQAWVIQSTQNVGVRNLSVDGSGTTTVAGIGFDNAYNVWAQGVRVIHAYDIGVWLINTAHATVADSYIFDVGQNFAYVDPWGIKDTLGTANLYQNNIIQATRICVANGEGPASGDVTAYNVCINDYNPNDYIFGSYWQHANGDDFNLYEGNVGTYLNEDGIHGTHMMITAFRNLFTGWESCANGQCGTYKAKAAGTSGIQILAYNRYANIVGNVLGTPGVTKNYSFSSSGYYANSLSAYNLGSGNGAASPAIPLDPLVSSTLMRWGNWDVASGAALFCTGTESSSGACTSDERGSTANVYSALSSPLTTLPASFYLTAQPAWWPSSIPYPAIGPDVKSGNLGVCSGTLNATGQYAGLPALTVSQCSPGPGLNASQWGGHVNAIPALACYLNVMNGRPDGTGSALAFDASTCYPNSSNTSKPKPAPPINVNGTVNTP